MRGGRNTFLALAGTALALGFVATGTPAIGGADRSPDEVKRVDPSATATTIGVGPQQQRTKSTAGPDDVSKKSTPPRPGLECAPGRNGGATDVGVSATEIRVASTVVLDGNAASLLSASPVAMRAVVSKVNRSGGICGRQLKLSVANDSFDAGTGQRYLRNFIDDKNFALTVVPSAEGLSNAISGGYIAKAQVPVVGTDGMRIEQYEEPWVWPVATATASTMRIMAKYGREQKKANTFAIVYDSKYQFGLEGAKAFEDQVKSLGGTLTAKVALDPDKTAYGSEVDTFNRACASGCDMVAMLLLPDAARSWMSAGPKAARLYTSAAQTLFSKQFAQQCVQASKNLCAGINVWTGYNPPIGPLTELPGVRQYINDVKSVDPGVDVENQFAQGAYLGMTVFVEALRHVGPDLTRARLREELDKMDFKTDLSPTLSWRPGRHHANGRARAFSMVVAQGTFTGWRDENTGFIIDPALEGRS